MSHKALGKEVGYFDTLLNWHDMEMEYDQSRAWLPSPDGFDPLRDYVETIDSLLITGYVSCDDFNTLRKMRKDLNRLHQDFVKYKIEGNYEYEGGGQDNE